MTIHNEFERKARAMTEAWITAHDIVSRDYPQAHYEFSEAGPAIEIKLNATTGLLFGTCEEYIGAGVEDIIGDEWEPTGTGVDTDVPSDSEDGEAIARAILKATRDYLTDIRHPLRIARAILKATRDYLTDIRHP